MPSRDIDLDVTVEPSTEAGVLYRLLDPAFGLFAWAIHFLVVYVATAVACVVGVGSASPGIRSTVTTALVAVTLLAAATVIWHAVRTWRRPGQVLDRRFLIRVTVGLDALGAVAILWQLFPLLLVPPCR